jgi:putative membrane protein
MLGIYCGEPPLPEELWGRWNFDPVVIVALAVLGVLLRRSSSGRWAAVVLAVLFISPLCALSSALFSVRTVHHVLLVAVAAPLLALSIPARRPGLLGLPFAVATAVLWFWHWPVAYELALSHKGIYWLMQLALAASAVWYWRSILVPGRNPVDAMLFTLAGIAQMGLLGALLTFAPQPLYEAHAVAPFAWSLTPLADQQLAGLIMWVPAGIPYVVFAVRIARQGWMGFQQGDS